MTREGRAAVAAVGTGLLVLSAVGVFALVQRDAGAAAGPLAPGVAGEGASSVAEVAPTAPPDTLLERGRAVYAAENCARCHSIAGVGSPRFPLDGVGALLTPEELRLWVLDPQALRPGVRKPSYDHLSRGDVAALVSFLETLR